MPNRLCACVDSSLVPHADSSIAWAIVTAAGTPHRCCAAIAPGATELRNACWADVVGAEVEEAAGLVLCWYFPDDALPLDCEPPLLGVVLAVPLPGPDAGVPSGTSPGMSADCEALPDCDALPDCEVAVDLD